MKISFACAAAALLAVSAVATAKSVAPAPAIPRETLQEFARPHSLVDVGGGRKINLFCMGSGELTVLFDSGGSDWSVIWGLVQPHVARGATACSYDRAGLGYSDPAAGARSPIAIVQDMRALIKAAKLKTPLVLVGHSLGGFNVKLYAAIYPEDVAGMVLVDPSEERSAERTRDRFRERFGESMWAQGELAEADWLRRLVAHYQNCAAEARKGDFDPASTIYRRCSDPVREPLGPAIAAERARIQVKTGYQEAQASEIANSVYGDGRGDTVYRALFKPGRLGTRPLVVLTHGEFDSADPVAVADQQVFMWLHAETAALSARGVHRVVPNTSHNIEIDDPAAVVAAVNEVLAQLSPESRQASGSK